MKFDLEKRLVKLAVMTIRVARKLPSDKVGQHLANQLVRSGTAPALLYGEAQSAESRRDFVHKMKIGLKELRETSINLTIIIEAGGYDSPEEVNLVLGETRELIAIFHKSISTAQKNLAEADRGRTY
jgi:four helix bundle protein